MNLKDLIIDVGTPNYNCELCKKFPGKCDGSCFPCPNKGVKILNEFQLQEVTISMEDINDINKKYTDFIDEVVKMCAKRQFPTEQELNDLKTKGLKLI